MARILTLHELFTKTSELSVLTQQITTETNEIKNKKEIKNKEPGGGPNKDPENLDKDNKILILVEYDDAKDIIQKLGRHVLEIKDQVFRKLVPSKWPHVIGALKHKFYKLASNAGQIKLKLEELARSRGFNKFGNIDDIIHKIGEANDEITKMLIDVTPEIVDKFNKALEKGWLSGKIASFGEDKFIAEIENILVEFRLFIKHEGATTVEIAGKSTEFIDKYKISISTAYVL